MSTERQEPEYPIATCCRCGAIARYFTDDIGGWIVDRLHGEPLKGAPIIGLLPNFWMVCPACRTKADEDAQPPVTWSWAIEDDEDESA